MIIIGGVQWATSAASPYIKLNARRRITKALTGLIMLLAIFLIMREINPDLLTLRGPKVSSTTPGGELQSYNIRTDCSMNQDAVDLKQGRLNEAQCHNDNVIGPCGDACRLCCKEKNYFGFGFVSGFKAVGQALRGESFNDVDCTCVLDEGTYNLLDPIKLTAGTDCNYMGTTDSCSSVCFNKCREKYPPSGDKNTIGVLSAGNNKTYRNSSEFLCDCYEVSGNSIFMGITRAETVEAPGQPCECVGEATPKCSDYCQNFCTQEKNAKYGYVSGCIDGSGTDKANCTCLYTQ
jgi:hypothetical protein